MIRNYRAVLLMLLGSVACDPVLDDAVSELGGEVGNVHPGPLHRPGQPCLLCHDGELGDPPEFSIAGTVFLQPTGTKAVNRATVELHGADDSTLRLVTNAAGNFYVSANQFKPVFPLEVKVDYQNEVTTMHSVIGRDGSCAGCHSDPAGSDSPGHVYVRLDDGGVPE
jgi:hypothetical protein